jgi:hypothetical protein
MKAVKVLIDHNDGEPDHIVGEFIGWHDGTLALIDVSMTTGYSGVTVKDERLGSECRTDMIVVDADLVKPADWYVTVYEVDRSYGGSEEGGWWYDTGTVVHEEVYSSELTAKVMAERLREDYPNNGSSYSVVYGGGDYRVRVTNCPGKNYPEHHPHYE